MTHALDGHALEGVFEKVKLDCRRMSDPALQLALVRHNPRNANEVFLISLRDCVGGLPAGHPLRAWLSRRPSVAAQPAFRPVLEALQGPLRDAWDPDAIPTKAQRAALNGLLTELEPSAPYADLTLLRALAYHRLGNWARGEAVLREWLELPPTARAAAAPVRHDALGNWVRDHFAVYAGFLKGAKEERAVVDFFLHALSDQLSDTKSVEEAEDLQDLSQGAVLEKLSLRYYRGQLPGFSAWMLNRHLEGSARRRFLGAFFSSGQAARMPWVFVGRLPDTEAHTDELAKILLAARTTDPRLFYVLGGDTPLLTAMQRLEPSAVRHFLDERRQFFLNALRARADDPVALAQLVELGQVDEGLVRAAASR